jgi:hypothetical protein
MKIEITIENKLNQQQLQKLLLFLKKQLTNAGIIGDMQITNVLHKESLGFSLKDETLDLGLGLSQPSIPSFIPQEVQEEEELIGTPSGISYNPKTNTVTDVTGTHKTTIEFTTPNAIQKGSPFLPQQLKSTKEMGLKESNRPSKEA